MEHLISDAAQNNVIDVTVQNFMTEVVEASKTQAVIVQFWAPWCGPCKQLGPVLEKIVGGYKNIRLARVNIDENQQIAAQMQVQSVPTVYGIIDGRPVDGFTGAQSESSIRKFVDIIAAQAPGEADITALIEAGGQALSLGNADLAMSEFQQALDLQPDSLEAIAGIIRAFVARGEIESAREIIDMMDADRRVHIDMREAVSAVELAEKTTQASAEITPLRTAIHNNPDDFQAYQDLALGLFAADQKEEAMAILLESIKRDKDWQDGAAKIQLFEFFSALGAADPIVIAARRKLSTYLFS